jgi:transglutaminase-like putative cysteine protease
MGRTFNNGPTLFNLMFMNRLTVRVGCRLVYQSVLPTPIVLIVRPRLSPHQFFIEDNLVIEPKTPYEEVVDWLGNPVERWELPPGQTIITNDSVIEVPAFEDDYNRRTASTPVVKVPPDVFRYLLPSRYCDSDKVQDFASRQFGYLVNGVDRVIAISNWVHHNIQYVTGSGRPDISASEIMARGYGVCRDFAHVAIALCRAVNIPARYVTGHLPDIGVWDPGSPMDFHAYTEVFLDGQWCVFDARYNSPRIGRVKIAHGLDAADCAFSTTFGDARLISIKVWAYQVDRNQVAIGDPVDMSKRLDGTPVITYA